MASAPFVFGDLLLALLIFSDGQGSKKRPVLVVYDFGDGDLLVVPVTSHPPRVSTDVVISDWKGASLKLPSTVRLEKLATIGKSCVVRKLGRLLPADLASVQQKLATVLQQVLPR
jgi:mRNA interferase MazF